jgi:hypothetical protein
MDLMASSKNQESLPSRGGGKKNKPEHLAKTQQIFTKIATNKQTQKKKLDDLFGG